LSPTPKARVRTHRSWLSPRRVNVLWARPPSARPSPIPKNTVFFCQAPDRSQALRQCVRKRRISPFQVIEGRMATHTSRFWRCKKWSSSPHSRHLRDGVGTKDEGRCRGVISARRSRRPSSRSRAYFNERPASGHQGRGTRYCGRSSIITCRTERVRMALQGLGDKKKDEKISRF